MFGIGMPELLVIFVIALLVFGPAELPKLAKNLGRMMAEFKRTSDDLMHQIHQELDAAGAEETKATEPAPEVPFTTAEEGEAVPADAAPTAEAPRDMGPDAAAGSSASAPSDAAAAGPDAFPPVGSPAEGPEPPGDGEAPAPVAAVTQEGSPPPV